jgi:uridylate kinase
LKTFLDMKYKRILLKLSGESLMGDGDYGIDSKMLAKYANEISEITKKSVEVAIVIGGGNIYRGIQSEGAGFDRVQGDHMGMLATIINGMALQSALQSIDIDTRLLTAIRMEQVAEPYIRRRAMRHLQKGRVVIFGGGTGNPYFTTDTAAALRAIEIEADIIFKGTRVDGIYSSDPEKNPNAQKYDTISFDEVLQKKLSVMDLTAFTLCQENKLPIKVFNMNIVGNLTKVCQGHQVGTLVKYSIK